MTNHYVTRANRSRCCRPPQAAGIKTARVRRKRVNMTSPSNPHKRKALDVTDHVANVAYGQSDDTSIRFPSTYKRRKQPQQDVKDPTQKRAMQAPSEKEAKVEEEEQLASDRAFFEALRAFHQQRGEDVYGALIQRHFPAPAHWTLGEPRQVYVAQPHAQCRADAPISAWEVAVEVAQKLTAFIQNQQARQGRCQQRSDLVYVAHIAQWVKESSSSAQSRYQLVLHTNVDSPATRIGSAKRTAEPDCRTNAKRDQELKSKPTETVENRATVIALATAAELRQMYGPEAIAQHRQFRKTFVQDFGHGKCVNHTTAHGEQHRDMQKPVEDAQLYAAVTNCIESIRQGWEPDAEPVLTVESDIAALTKRLMCLQQQRAIGLEDIDAVLQAVQNREFDQRVVRQLGEITDADVELQERQENKQRQAVAAAKRRTARQQPSGPQTLLSRKLFGVLAR